MAGSTNYVPGWNGTKTVATYCDTATKTMKIGDEANAASHTAPLFPCPHVAAITVDASDNPICREARIRIA